MFHLLRLFVSPLRNILSFFFSGDLNVFLFLFVLKVVNLRPDGFFFLVCVVRLVLFLSLYLWGKHRVGQ